MLSFPQPLSPQPSLLKDLYAPGCCGDFQMEIAASFWDEGSSMLCLASTNSNCVSCSVSPEHHKLCGREASDP